MKKTQLILSLFITINVMSQSENKLPYYQIPDYPETYTAATVSVRMMDGLGFRYYWATEGLRDEDLKYKPSESGRTTSETIDHLYGLSEFILSTLLKRDRKKLDENTSFEEKRKLTLLNIKQASNVLKKTEDISEFDNDKFPFWNLINGPIADALWHCGQVVMLRRASGNPFNSKVSVFNGKLRD